MNILVNNCPNLRKLKIENNNIKEFDQLKNLSGLNIKKINIKGNPFTEGNNEYIKELYKIFLSLICINDIDKEGNEVESTEYGDTQNYFQEIDKNKDSEENDEIEYSFVFNDSINDIENESENEEESEEEDDENDSKENNDCDNNNNDKNLEN